MNFLQRRAACAAALADQGVDALIVSNLTNVRYLTGMVSSSAKLLIHATGRSVLMTDFRYREQAALAASADDIEAAIVDSTRQSRELVDIAAGAKRLGLESEHVTWSAQRALCELAGDGVEVVPTTGLVELLRTVKEPEEVALIERAAHITDQALEQVLDMLTNRPTERQFRTALDRAMIDLGADDLSFATIIASGPNAARPHHSPENRVIEAGDLVVVDCGSLVDGYHSDMTRTFCVGEPDAQAAAMLELATEAHAAGMAAVRPGVTGEQIDAAARAVIVDAGRGDEFAHGVGHGVGLDIHEVPFLRGSDMVLQVGQVVTVEPGVYRSGVGGARAEDTVVVTEDGCRPLTAFANNPIVG